ncbi:MAG: IPT/TIG domain-containing protein [Phycisphaerae bacterium]|nr:IPT/TIG domain-containing protein [Phycisphaerae bacterium]
MFIIRNSGVPVWVLVATIFVCGCPQAGEERTDNGTANDGQVQNGDDGTQGGNGSAGDQPIHVDGPVSLGDPGAPRIFFSDLISGPSHGGYNDAGAIVTLYGNGFGDQRGSATVTIGGGQAAAYLAWSNTRIAVQIGPQASSGDIIVHCGAGDSNGLPFTVRDDRRLLASGPSRARARRLRWRWVCGPG